jgi:TatD DNase family protein
VDRPHWPGHLFDTHCHLHFPELCDDLDQVLDRARGAGIAGILVPSLDLPSSRVSSRIAGERDLWSAAGFHPNHLEEASEDNFRGIGRLCLLPQAAAVGETGLDHYRDRFPRELQLFWFQRHVHLAQALELPLVVHSRGAEEEVLDVLPRNPPFPVILHSWNGGSEATGKAVARGFHLGFTGAVTYRRSVPAGIFDAVPRELVLAETDAPFLPPEPFRGRRNEPAHTRETVRWIAGRWGVPVAEACSVLWENSLRAFRLHPGNRRTHLVYPMEGRLYVNLTGQCNSDCIFCVRKQRDGIGGYYLRHRAEPSRESVLAALEAARPRDYSEVVFCGYGEPTLRPDLLAEAADAASAAGVETRLNTNGLCLDHLGPLETADLLKRFTRVSISLNASGASEYRRVCPGRCDDGWEKLMSFIRLVGKLGIPGRLTAVSGSGADIPRVRALASRLEMPFTLRGEP